jgi:hypothetical protein
MQHILKATNLISGFYFYKAFKNGNSNFALGDSSG